MNETEEKSVEVLPKPGLLLMGMLALLGDRALHSSAVIGVGAPNASAVGVLATSRGLDLGLSAASQAESGSAATRWETATLYYASLGTANTSAVPDAPFALALNGLPRGGRAVLAHYRIDPAHSNPRALWATMGGATNPYPSAAQFRALRAASELSRISLRTIDLRKRGAIRTLRFALPTPAVGLLHICSAPPAEEALAAVRGVALRVTPTRAPPTVFVRWADVAERCIATYAVEWRRAPGSAWVRVNERDTIFAAHVHAQPNATKAVGCYRVVASDYFNRTALPSADACV